MMTSTKPDALIGDLFKVLADPLRRRLVHLLADEQLCTCHLVAETGAGQTAVSNHLRVLREAGMVDTEPCGRFTYYRLRPQALHALTAELAGLAALAQAAQGRKRPC
jgi:ArsR family transcriptional regulator, arsenate/arsenite/antimonite-responsive transcriptional repressor